MIKKLVQFGTSKALMLDEGLLEILGITDATELKITTDGASFTVTPITRSENETAPRHISVAQDECLMHYSQELRNAPEAAETLGKFHQMPPAARQKMALESAKIHQELEEQHHISQLEKELTENVPYQNALKELSQQARATNMAGRDYMLAMNELVKKHAPRLAEVREIAGKKFSELGKQYFS